MFVYIQSEKTLWTTGHYDPQGKWIPDKDFDNPERAAQRCHYLNGGVNLRIEELNERINELIRNNDLIEP